MAEMEGIETAGGEESEESEEEEGEVSELVSYKVNEDITLAQPELCVIYTCLHWAWKTKDAGWNDIKIKQIVGHAMLELDDDKYHRLDLENVIKHLRNEKHDLARDVKVPTERYQNNWLKWIPQLHEKYLDMCRHNEKLAKQRDDEQVAQQAAQGAASLTLPEKRRRIQQPETYPSIPTVLSGPSSGS